MSLPATIEDEPFKSYDDAIRAVRGVANSQGFAITIQRSERGPNNKVKWCHFRCDRGHLSPYKESVDATIKARSISIIKTPVILYELPMEHTTMTLLGGLTPLPTRDKLDLVGHLF
ncbi:hypothetical protein CCM_02909 [Cordyceps militaris CM01]|uniref:Uncharacterized protein n=1 Tax=Cordyceps militaris (strain CM01) TaxID=983644 RepID=G3JCH7_CORMM|nr:uncharacterized protein CCM_02909 [Cordyceps militaris CM01]EGX94638.1 hypothetical protein CCM_02909 [Cordyceps militaris CM01]